MLRYEARSETLSKQRNVNVPRRLDYWLRPERDEVMSILAKRVSEVSDAAFMQKVEWLIKEPLRDALISSIAQVLWESLPRRPR